MTVLGSLRGIATILVVAHGVAASSTLTAQHARTLREAVTLAGFADALDAPAGRDWDRPLTSSDFGSDKDTFVAACYFENELKREILGPLHLYRFSRVAKAWTYRALPEAAGSVMSVNVAPHTILVQAHWNPSAGSILVLDDTLKPIATLEGSRGVVLPDDSVLFKANLVHFAPTHPERLLVFERASGRTTGIFPGPRESRLAIGVRRAIRAAVAGLPASELAELRESGGPYGLPNDFDRGVLAIATSADGRQMAFVVSYGNSRITEYTHVLVNDEYVPKAGSEGTTLETLATCRRSPTAIWTCQEERLESAARRLGVPFVARQSQGWLASLDVVTAATVRRR